MISGEIQFDTAGRPIYPNLPYSPYTSPCSSPRYRSSKKLLNQSINQYNILEIYWHQRVKFFSHLHTLTYKRANPSSSWFSLRVKRKPLKETKRVSSEQNGDYVQLNQYKLQVIHDTYFGLSIWVRLMNCDLKNWFDGCCWMLVDQ